MEKVEKQKKVYDYTMKYVFLAIFVLIASQPMQVSSCDMDDTRQTSQHGSDNIDHGNMDHGNMDHGGGNEMDCCDHDPAVPSDNCDSMVDCGLCTAAVMAFSVFTMDAIFKTDTQLYLPDIDDPLSRFKTPPFRPPIA